MEPLTPLLKDGAMFLPITQKRTGPAQINPGALEFHDVLSGPRYIEFARACSGLAVAPRPKDCLLGFKPNPPTTGPQADGLQL